MGAISERTASVEQPVLPEQITLGGIIFFRQRVDFALGETSLDPVKTSGHLSLYQPIEKPVEVVKSPIDLIIRKKGQKNFRGSVRFGTSRVNNNFSLDFSSVLCPDSNEIYRIFKFNVAERKLETDGRVGFSHPPFGQEVVLLVGESPRKDIRVFALPLKPEDLTDPGRKAALDQAFQGIF